MLLGLWFFAMFLRGEISLCVYDDWMGEYLREHCPDQLIQLVRMGHHGTQSQHVGFFL